LIPALAQPLGKEVSVVMSGRQPGS